MKSDVVNILLILVNCKIQVLLGGNEKFTIPLLVSQVRHLSPHKHLPILLCPVRGISKTMPCRDLQFPSSFPAVLNMPFRRTSPTCPQAIDTGNYGVHLFRFTRRWVVEHARCWYTCPERRRSCCGNGMGQKTTGKPAFRVTTWLWFLRARCLMWT
jgi:hypothetical protein